MWMIYGVALTLYILWGRALPFVFDFVGIEIPDEVIKEGAGWIGALVTLAIAHWWLHRARAPKKGRARQSRRAA
ncbi:hypothetical protein NORO109296_18625 [Nocardiopsis rhodophaea]